MSHISVLLKESIDALNLRRGSIVFDGTLGGAGHSAAIVQLFGRGVKIIGTDLDEQAIRRAEDRLGSVEADYILVRDSFRNIKSILANQNIPRVDAILLDLGLSSFQLDEPGYGMSFKHDEPLTMTFAKERTDDMTTAFEVVNDWKLETLVDIFQGFSDEKFAYRIAKGIVAARELHPIMTTAELAQIVKDSVPVFARFGKIHPATKVFQAIRIAVNDEMGAVNQVIKDGFEVLGPGGRMAIITFHSVEDRLVKHRFRDLVEKGLATDLTRKPIVPTEKEIEANPRARSAKLRIIEKI